MKFTKPLISTLKLPHDKSELIVFDDAMPGFGLRLRAGGKRTWIAQFRIGQRQRRLTIGSLAVMDLDEARTEAKKALSKAGLAIDPQAEKLQARVNAAVTLKSVIDRHLKVKKGTLRPRSYEESRRHLEKDWAPLHGHAVSSIRQANVAALLHDLVEGNGRVAADRARASLSAMFSWAMGEGLADANPVALTNRPAEPVRRDRVLSDSDLREVWTSSQDDDYGRVVRLLILTGQRREEVSAITWEEIDTSKAIWSIPGGRTKNGRPHDVPLSDLAIGIIEDVSVREDRPLLFGSGENGFSGWSKAKLALDERINELRKAKNPKAKPITPWRLHDLRRTLATRLGDLGVLPHTIEAVLNHISGTKAGVAGTYNRSLYAAEKRAALDLWAVHVQAIVSKESAKVVAMRRA